MKKRVRFILTASVLMIAASILLWKIVPWKSLPDKLKQLSEWEMPYFLVYTLILIGTAVVILTIWKSLDVVPKRQAAAVAKTKALIKPTELFSIENEARKTLSQIIGGVVVIIGLLFTGANLAITQREAEKNRSLALEGQITDRFTKAITQLGDEKLEVRLGGIYALERIAKDSEKDHWTIIEVLTAYVREHAPNKKLDNAMKPSSNKRATDPKQQEDNAKLRTDIQATLTVIGRRMISEKRERNNLDLARVGLSKANLRNANLHKANLRVADLSKAILIGADLSGANLYNAGLSGASFGHADLRKADLNGADLSGAILNGADLSGAILGHADLSGAILPSADLSGAILLMAKLNGAKLGTVMNLTWEQVSDAIIDDFTELPYAIESQHKDELKVMREQTKKERGGR